jgi:hypothetical protein
VIELMKRSPTIVLPVPFSPLIHAIRPQSTPPRSASSMGKHAALTRFLFRELFLSFERSNSIEARIDCAAITTLCGLGKEATSRAEVDIFIR